MSMFFCEGCEKLVDNDFFPCQEDPRGVGLLCPDCMMEMEEANDKPWSETVKGASLRRSHPSEER
jgi:hypothetical protein